MSVLAHVQLHEQGTVVHSSLDQELEAQLEATLKAAKAQPVKNRVRRLALKTKASHPRLMPIAIRLVRT